MFISLSRESGSRALVTSAFNTANSPEVSGIASSPRNISRVPRFKRNSPNSMMVSSALGAPGASTTWRRNTALIRASNSRGLNGLGR
ncbi:Uncharacterised protein [Vibrio cholerae]|nr:Uncharacterised protein [Vibrio cholerae]